jgi:hypothetical protein
MLASSPPFILPLEPSLVSRSVSLPAIYTTAACLLPDAVPFQLSTPSLARDVLPVCVSVRLRGAQPARMQLEVWARKVLVVPC